MPAIYLAGPDVFEPDAAAIGREKIALCAGYGFTGLFPLADEQAGQPPSSASIYQHCVDLMRQADLGIFNLSPFRGPGADPGTAFELGFMVALRKPVFGYTTAMSDYRERVAGARFAPERGCWVDEAGRLVEDFGGADNLMLDEPILAVGGPFYRAKDGLAGLEACLSFASRSKVPQA